MPGASETSSPERPANLVPEAEGIVYPDWFRHPEQFFDATIRSTTISAEARRIHDAAIVIGLHADTTLWDRDLGARGQHGHVDFSRLREGGVDGQAFMIAMICGLPERRRKYAQTQRPMSVRPSATVLSPNKVPGRRSSLEGGQNQ
jgi:hypothetical protein